MLVGVEKCYCIYAVHLPFTMHRSGSLRVIDELAMLVFLLLVMSNVLTSQYAQLDHHQL